jgi:glycine oxidase
VSSRPCHCELQEAERLARGGIRALRARQAIRGVRSWGMPLDSPLTACPGPLHSWLTHSLPAHRLGVRLRAQSGHLACACDRRVHSTTASVSCGSRAGGAESQLTSPSPCATLALASVSYLPRLSEELLEASGINIGLRASGTLRVATSEQQAASQRKRLPEQVKLGLELDWLSGAEARNLEPALPDLVVGAVYGPHEAQLDAMRLVRAYRVAAERRGATSERAVAQRLLKSGNAVTGVQTSAESRPTGNVVLAMGAWAAEAGKWLGVEIPVEPERGQIVVASDVACQPQHILFIEQMYLAPKGRTRVIVGAARDRAGYDGRATLSGVSELLARSFTLMPQMSHATWGGVRSGLRPRTPDGIPIIGPVPGLSGVSLATGHGSNGLLFSALTGQSIASHLTHRPSPIETASYQIGRRLSQKQLHTSKLIITPTR